MDLSKIPLFWAVIITGIILVGIAIWAALHPRKYIYEGAETKARWRDVRIWAVLLMAIQLAIYAVWGG